MKRATYRQAKGWETAYSADKDAIKKAVSPRRRKCSYEEENRKSGDLTGWAYISLYSVSLICTLAYFYYLNSNTITEMVVGKPAAPQAEESTDQ